MSTTNTTVVILEDPAVCAFLAVHTPNLKIRPQASFNNRVAFAIEGTERQIKEALAALAANVPVPSRSLLDELKRLRTEMFRMKAAASAGRG